MADRIIDHALGQYLSIFIKNYKRSSLSVSVMSGKGTLKDIELNEHAVQEVLPFGFMQTDFAKVNRLEIRLPSLTRLTNDPITLFLDRVTIQISEPVKGRRIQTPLQDLLERLRSTKEAQARKAAKNTSSNASAKSKKSYGLVDRIIDGLRLQINQVDLSIKTLGHSPSKMMGKWTPPIIHVQLKDISLNTTNTAWEVADLKKALPKPTPQTKSMRVCRLAKAESVTVRIVHPLVQKRGGEMKFDKSDNWRPTNFIILDRLPLSLKITQVKTNTGITVAVHMDFNINSLHIKVDRHELEALVRCLMGLSSASRRKDLIQARLEYMMAKKSRQMISMSKTATLNSSNWTSASSNTMSTTTTSKHSSSRGNAISKFIKKQQQREQKQVSYSSRKTDSVNRSESLNSIPSTDSESLGLPNQADLAISTDIPMERDDESVLGEYSDDDVDSEDVNEEVLEMIADYPEMLTSKTIGETSQESPPQKHNQPLAMRIIVNFSMDQFHMSIIKRDESEAISGGYHLEILGAEISVIIPEDAPMDKVIQFNIPYAHFRDLQLKDKTSAKGRSSSTTFESKWGRMRKDRFEELSYFLRPKIRAYQSQEWTSNDKGPSKSTSNFTIDNVIWPEFLRTSIPTTTLHILANDPSRSRSNSTCDTDSSAYHTNQYRRVSRFRPEDQVKRRFFEPGKEMFRLKIQSNPEDFITEMRVNPVQLVLNVKSLIRLTEFILESMPDLETEPPDESRLELPKYTPPKKTITPDENDSDDTVQRGFSFIIEMRQPHILFPSNFSMTGRDDDDDVIDDVSELLLISMQEAIITCDERIPRHPFTHEQQPDALYCVSEEFPGKKDTDFTTKHHAMWESLPWKLKFQISSFMVELLPSLANLQSTEFSEGEDSAFLQADSAPPSSTEYRIIDPLSLTFDLGINDPSISVFHRKLPKVLWLGHIEEIHIHLNQNQLILLLELLKTYADDPPELSTVLIRNTQTFARKQAAILEESRLKFATEEQRERMDLYQKQMRDLIPVFVLAKLSRLLITLKDGGGGGGGAMAGKSSSSTGNTHAEYTDLAKFQIDGIQLLAETHPQTKLLVFKGRMNSLQLLTPPNSKDPSAVMIATSMIFDEDHVDDNATEYSTSRSHTRLSHAQRRYILEKRASNIMPTTYPVYMIQWRLEQPLHKLLSSHLRKGKDSEQFMKEYLTNTTYLKNGKMQMELHSIHIGINANSAFRLVQFLNSRNNAFDVSPLEVINRTVRRTYGYVREKYLPKKMKNNLSKKKVLRTMDEFLSFDEDAVDASLSSRRDGRKKTLPPPPLPPRPLSKPVQYSTERRQCDVNEQIQEMAALDDAADAAPAAEHDMQEAKIVMEANGSSEDDIGANPIEDVAEEQSVEVVANETKEAIGHDNYDGEDADKVVEEVNIEKDVAIEDAENTVDNGDDNEEVVPRGDGDTDQQPVEDDNDNDLPSTSHANNTPPAVIQDDAAESQQNPILEPNEESSDKDQQKPEAESKPKAKVHAPFFPILWDVKTSHVEIFLIDDGTHPNAFGLEVQSLRVKHIPAVSDTIAQTDEHGIIISYNTLEHEFDVVVHGEKASFGFILNDKHQYSHDLQQERKTTLDDDDLKPEEKSAHIRHHDISDLMEFRISLRSDYKRPLTQRGLSLHFVQVEPDGGNTERSSSTDQTPSSAFATVLSQVISITPEMTYVLFKLVKGQILELGKFMQLISYFRRSIGVNLTADLRRHFDKLNEHLSQGQRSVSRAELQHDSLKRSLLEVLNEMEEKDQALHTTIEAKMNMVEVLASFQEQQHQRDAEHEKEMRQLMLQNRDLTQKVLKYQQTTTTPVSVKPTTEVIMEGYCMVLPHNQINWKKAYCVLLSTETLLVLTTKLSHQLATSYKTRDDIRMKYVFYDLPLSSRTEAIEMPAPVANTDTPKKVLALINSESERLFLRPSDSSESINTQNLKKWMMNIKDIISELKERDAKRTIATQTGTGGLEIIEEEEEEEQQQQQQSEDAPNRDVDTNQKNVVDLDEIEIQYLEYLTRRKQVMISKSKEHFQVDGVQEPRELGTNSERSIDHSDQEKKKSLSEEQETSLLLHEWREMQQLSVQYQLLKRSLLVSRDEQEMIQQSVSKLIAHVQRMRLQEKSRLHNINVRLREDEARQREINREKQRNRELRAEIERNNAEITALGKQLSQETESYQNLKEENEVLSISLRNHIMLMETELQKAKVQKQKVEKQLEMYKKKDQKQQEMLYQLKHADTTVGGYRKSVTGFNLRQKTAGVLSKVSGSSKQQTLLAAALSRTGQSGEELAHDRQEIVDSLYQQMEEKDALIERLKRENIRLRSSVGQSADNQIEDNDSKRAKPLPVPPTRNKSVRSLPPPPKKSLPPPPSPYTSQQDNHPTSIPDLDSFFENDTQSVHDTDNHADIEDQTQETETLPSPTESPTPSQSLDSFFDELIPSPTSPADTKRTQEKQTEAEDLFH